MFPPSLKLAELLNSGKTEDLGEVFVFWGVGKHKAELFVLTRALRKPPSNFLTEA